MVCHGELARLKPDPRHLTEFYLLIAAGGALGGLFVAVVAPLMFSTYFRMADRRGRLGRAGRRAADLAADCCAVRNCCWTRRGRYAAFGLLAIASDWLYVAPVGGIFSAGRWIGPAISSASSP